MVKLSPKVRSVVILQWSVVQMSAKMVVCGNFTLVTSGLQCSGRPFGNYMNGNVYGKSVHLAINKLANFPSHSQAGPGPGFAQSVKYCFAGLSRTCKDQIPGFSRTHKTGFQGFSRINSVHKHGCLRSKKCTHRISYQYNCITVNKPKFNNCCCINVLQ